MIFFQILLFSAGERIVGRLRIVFSNLMKFVFIGQLSQIYLNPIDFSAKIQFDSPEVAS